MRGSLPPSRPSGSRGLRVACPSSDYEQSASGRRPRGCGIAGPDDLGDATIAPTSRRILFPYVGTQLSISALDAALRIAHVEQATLVPAYLAPVPMALPLEAPMPRTCTRAFELQEAIEQRATAAGVPVDGRIGPGRTVRHALRELLTTERYDRIIVAAATAQTDGLSSADVAWLLEHAPGEVVILRPADEAALAAA